MYDIQKKNGEVDLDRTTNTYTFILTSNLADYKYKEKRMATTNKLHFISLFIFISFFFYYKTHYIIQHHSFPSLLTVIQRRDKDYRCIRVSLKKRRIDRHSNKHTKKKEFIYNYYFSMNLCIY